MSSGFRQRPFILHDSASQYHYVGVGSASIKTFHQGRALYRLERGTELIEPGQFLLLNDDQPYEITIESPHDVESLCVFFPTGMAGHMASKMTRSTENQLDNPCGAESYDGLPFLDRVYAPHPRIQARLNAVRANHSMFAGDNLWIDEQVSLLLRELILFQSSIQRSMLRIPATRASTRVEIMRRALIAYEWIRANYQNQVTLPALSRIAALSENHLIRCYHQIFGVTPHQHVLSLRLMEAARLLLQTELSVLEICNQVGFSSPSTFTGTFRKRTGFSPTRFRLAMNSGDFEEDVLLSMVYTEVGPRELGVLNQWL